MFLWPVESRWELRKLIACLAVTYLLQKVALEVDEVVGLDDVGAALAAEHSGEQRLHGRRTLPRAHHGVGYLSFTGTYENR